MKTKLEKQKQEASEWLKKHGVSNLIPEAMQKIEKDHKRKQKRNHVIFWIIVFSVVVGIMNKVTAQTSDNLIVLGGYKSIEAGYVFENEDFLNFGISVSAADSKIIQDRMNRNDIYRKIHVVKSDIVPTAFLTFGATFERLTITGKAGASLIDQTINGETEKQKIYPSIGIMFSHKLTNRYSVIGSYDSTNALTFGVGYRF